MQLIFGGFIAVMLLGLYVYAVVVALMVVTCVATTGCTQYTVATFSDGFAGAMTTIGGLVSALVIAELAVTKPGEAPIARAITTPGQPAGPTATKILVGVTGVYLLVWVLTGL